MEDKNKDEDESYDYKNLNKHFLYYKSKYEDKIDSIKYDINESNGIINKTKIKLNDLNIELDYLCKNIGFCKKIIADYEADIIDKQKELIIANEKLSDFNMILERAKSYPK